MKKSCRIVPVLLAIAMLFALLPMNVLAEEEIVKIVYASSFSAVAPSGFDKVIAAVNEITREEIGVEIEPLFLNSADYATQTNMMLSSGEVIDVYYPANGLAIDAAQGKLLPFSYETLQQYAPDAVAAVGEELMSAVKINGEYYGVPTVRDFGARSCVFYNKDVADELGLDFSSVRTPQDLTAIFAEIKDKLPAGMYCLGPNNSREMVTGISRNWDQLCSGKLSMVAVLENYGQDEPLTVTNHYATQAYYDTVKLVREWYLAGYTYPDASTDVNGGPVGLLAGKFLMYPGGYHPRTLTDVSAQAKGMQIGVILFDNLLGRTTTGNVNSTTMSVACTSEHPEKALEFINLMFKDARLVNLFNYGIEGEDYVRVEGTERTITFPEGINNDNVSYHVVQNWLFGNAHLGYVWEGAGDDLWEREDEFNKGLIASKAMGFTFDLTPVRTETAAIQNVVAEYHSSLACGEVDPDAYIPKFLSALEAAGANLLIEECQRQLDAWLEQQ